jgi:DNA-binding IclR family transcriptional regulator
MEQGASSTDEIVNKLGLNKRTGALQRTLKGLKKEGYIEYLYPESPRHPNQKYVLKNKE